MIPAASNPFRKPTPSTCQRVILYGDGGIGKTTLALFAPGAVLVDCDDSAGNLLHVHASPDILQPRDWTGLMAALQTPTAPHWQGRTIIIDNLSRAEEWAAAHTLQVDFAGNAQAFASYGKGQLATYKRMAALQGLLDGQYRAGRHIICLAHSQIEESLNEEGADWKKRTIKLSRSANANTLSLFFTWADSVGFISLPAEVREGVRKADTEKRIINFVSGMSVEAKARPANLRKKILTTGAAGSGPDATEARAFWSAVLGVKHGI